jgi:hypothetical protein|tara:strand:+ start:520 stop:726 length:207 start_codon:yes stop_codon:yes gene_type:complete
MAAQMHKLVEEKSPLEEAFEMGQRAFAVGILDSPYKKKSVLHREWQRGFNVAYFNNRTPERSANCIFT